MMIEFLRVQKYKSFIKYFVIINYNENYFFKSQKYYP